MKFAYLLHFALFLPALLLASCRAPVGSAPTFDDSAPDLLRLGNAYYELTLSKTNGALVGLSDQQRQQALLLGAFPNCLWALAEADEGKPAVESCAFAPADAAATFAYQWDDRTHQLTLHYAQNKPDAGGRLRVEVLVTPSAATWVDLQLRLHNDGARVIRRVALPATLALAPSAVTEALVPTLPGVLLDQQFFAKRARYEPRYPSWQGLFADYVALRVNTSTLTLYTVNPATPPISAQLAFVNNREAIRLSHTFYPYVPGAQSNDPWRTDNATDWQAPTVRLQVGAPYTATIDGYRRANQLNRFANLQSKLDDRYPQLTQSPLYKIEYDQPPTYWQDLLSHVPTPGLLHWVTYWQNGVFDEGYPDYLPPRASDTATLAALFAATRTQGFLNMPYTNPTWWDDESPTVQQLGPAAVALRNPDGSLRYECVNVPTANACTPAEAARDSTVNQGRQPWEWVHGGYPVSPYAPAVQQRIADGMAELTTHLGSAFVFEDQVGVGNVHCVPNGIDCRDYGPWVPNPAAFLQGWLDHSAQHSAVGLMTEVGYDRMAAHELGFHGGTYLFAVRGEADFWWGKGYWRPYPFATMLLRDKVLFFQHNLAPETFTDTLATLRWNLAMGYQLSYGLNVIDGRGGLESPWLQVVSLLQRELLAPHADQRIQEYTQLADQVTETRYGPVRVIANWQRAASYAFADHELAPEGFYLEDAASGSRAGAFTVYNGAPLPAGTQIIAEVHRATAIDLYYPLGNADTLVVHLPAMWPANGPIHLAAYGRDNKLVATTTLTATNQRVTVPYAHTLDNQTVDHYTLTAHR